MANIGALKAVLEASRPLALKTRAMAADIGQNLKGAVATGEQWYNQLRNIPGTKPGPLKAAYGHQQASPIQMSKDEFLQSVINPKLYTQRGFSRRSGEDAITRQHEIARDLMYDDPRFAEAVQEARRSRLALEDMPEYDEALSMASDMMSSVDSSHDIYEGIQTLKWRPEAYMPAKNWQPEYGQYFETVLRKAPQEGRPLTEMQAMAKKYIEENNLNDIYHFENPGQIASARGEYYPGAKSVFLHELQSDPLEALGKLKLRGTPGSEALSTPHGDMLKAMVLRASEGNADRVVVPSGEMITRIRDPQYRNFYEDVYDTQLAREVYSPLERLGIRIPTKQGGARVIELTPEIRANLNAYGLPFKKGGLAQACSCHQ